MLSLFTCHFWVLGGNGQEAQRACGVRPGHTAQRPLVRTEPSASLCSREGVSHSSTAGPRGEESGRARKGGRKTEGGGHASACVARHHPPKGSGLPVTADNQHHPVKLPGFYSCLPQLSAPSLIIGIYYPAHLLPPEGQKVNRRHGRCDRQGGWRQTDPDKCTFKRILLQEHAGHERLIEKIKPKILKGCQVLTH